MELTLLIIWILCLCIPVLSYVWFPLYLGRKAKGRKEPAVTKPSVYQPVTIIFSAFNEESVIERKLESIVKSDYPHELMTVLIGSDASTDATCDIIERYSSRYPFIRLHRHETRKGKLKVVNELVQKAATDLLVLTDANVFFEPATVGVLVAYLTDQAAQQVCANISKFSPKNAGISGQEIFYMGMENSIKYHESLAYGFVVGVEGGCYGIHRSWFTEVPDGFLMDDFFITLSVIEKQGKVLFAPEAVCYEDVNDEPMIEYRRKTRISIGNYRNLAFYRHLLFPFWKGFGMAFLMHKVFRWLTPFALILSFISSLLLASLLPVFKWISASYGLLLVFPILTIILNRLKVKVPLVNFAGHFLLMNFALLVGFYKYIFASSDSAWTPPKRNV